MPTLITQDKFEENILPNPRLTIALPYLAPLVIPFQVPKKRLNQIGLWGRTVLVPAPGPPPIQVGEHNRRGRKVEAHKRKVAVKSKATKSKKKTGKAKHSAFHNGQNDCKESVKLAKAL
jgi:acetylglutamate synthase